MLPTKFRFIWPNDYRREELTNMAATGNSCLWLYASKKKCFSVQREITNLNIDISKIQLGMNWITDKYASTTPQPNELKLGRKHLWERHKQSQQRTFHRCFLPSFGSFGRTVAEEKIFLVQPITNKSRLWWPCLLTDRDEMSILYRGPAIDASCQVSVHLARWFQRRRFKKIGQSRNLVGSILGRSSIKIVHFVPIH
jgi:hypothetical protein